jgi:DNA-binding MltR family transcriptional regulator
MKLVANPSSVDCLFEGGNAPFSSFSSKIDVAYRLGAISNRLCRDLHLVRKIRNDFAHNIEGCHFSDQKVNNRVRELRNKFADLIDIYKTEEAAKLFQMGDRGDFQFCSSWMIDYLYILSKSSKPLQEAPLEWAYDRPTMIERKRGANAKSA